MVRYYANRGMDPSPLLPLGVLIAVVFAVFTPLTMEALPRFMDAAQQMLALLWIVPVVIVTAIFMMSTENPSSSRRVYRHQPQYSTYGGTMYGGEGPRWGLLGLMLLMLLLLPWRH